MPSDKQIQAARANGAKSRGPKTPEGKQRSSLNAVKHGLTARTLVLDNESAADFDELCRQYLEEFQPAGRLETDLVQQMVSALWRQRRLWSIETALIDMEMDRREVEDDEIYEKCDPEARRAMAFKDLAGGGALGLVNRYETRLRRMYDRALRLLQEIQTARKAAGASLQNEPARPVLLPDAETPSALPSDSPALPWLSPTPASASQGGSQSKQFLQDEPTSSPLRFRPHSCGSPAFVRAAKPIKGLSVPVP
jgi:hypothetical protein